MTGYFIGCLICFQLLYSMGLESHLIGYPTDAILQKLSYFVLHSGTGKIARFFLVVSLFFLRLDLIKKIALDFIQWKNKQSIFAMIWIISTGTFLFFEELFLVHRCKYASECFLLLLLLSLFPFLGNFSHQASVKKKRSFKNPTKFKKDSVFSIAIPTCSGLLPLNNPQRGIMILGGAGSGKTKYILEPMLHAFIKKGYCGLLYDYKFEGVSSNPSRSYCLSKFVYNCLQLFDKQGTIHFKVINFTDLSGSVRLNPIAPRYISNRANLDEYVDVLLVNLNGVKQEDFWQKNASALLKSIIVYLCNQAPSLCTLPHVLELVSKPLHQLITLLKKDREASAYAHPVLSAADLGEKAAGQLAGVYANLCISLQRLRNRAVYWVLSKDDHNFSINDASNPTLFCLGNSPMHSKTFGPLIALLATVFLKQMYALNRCKSFVSLDELPTIFLPDLSELPATAREYGISTVACIQSDSQLTTRYGRDLALEIKDNLKNQFIGDCGIASATYGSSLLGKEHCIVSSVSDSTTCFDAKSNYTKGINQTIQEKETFPVSSFMSLPVGTFVGQVAESDSRLFHAAFQTVAALDKRFQASRLEELPILERVSDEMVVANQRRIEREVDALVNSVTS